MEFTHVINQMFVLCVPILVGYLAARLGYLDEDLNTKLSRLIVNIALPCLVVGSAFGTDGLPDAPVVLELMFYSAIGYAIAYLLALAIPALMRSSAAERGIYRFVVVFGNVGFIGNLTTPAALLVTGGTLAGYEPVSMLSNWRAYVAAIARLLIVPVAMLLVLRPLIADDFVRGVVVIGAAMPVASVGVLFCLAYGADTKPMMQSTFVAIIASVISIPLLALIV